jgi:hypothetical protein
MKIYRFIIVGLALQFYILQSQTIDVSQWTIETSLYSTNTALYIPSTKSICIGTSGGLIIKNANDSVSIYRANNGLLSSDISALGYDSVKKQLWVGASDGSIDILDFASQTWKHITDIKSTNSLPKKRIRCFLFTSNAILIGGDFGLISYDQNYAPGDYVEKIGSITQGTTITSLQTIKDTLWVTTEKGAGKIWMGVTSMRESEKWTVYTKNGLADSSLIGSIVKDDILYIATVKGISNYQNGIFKEVDTKGNQKINSISLRGNRIIYGDDIQLYTLDDNQVIPGSDNHGAQTGHSSSTDSTSILYLKSGGIIILKNSKAEKYIPNSPKSNLFLFLAISANGYLWSGAQDDRPQGFYTFGDNMWKNFSNTTNLDFAFNGFHKASAMSDGSIWLSNWGGGIVQAKPNSDTSFTYNVYNTTNSPLLGIGGGGYVVTGKAAEDRYGTVWFPNYDDAGEIGPVLIFKKKDGTFGSYQNGYSPVERKYSVCAIDNNSTKWLGSRNGLGLLYFNDKNTADLNDDIWNKLTTSNSNILDNIIKVITKDNNGVLWIGSAGGLNAIYNPSIILQGKNPSIVKVSVISSVNVNDIAIDAVNNKWIATTNGVYVLNEDGTEILKTIDMTNAPLETNDIKALALDNASGKVYIGTELGLLIGQTTIINPETDYSSLICYPQPFDPNTGNTLLIKGLAPESAVHIVTPSGMPITSLYTKSGLINWDGKDDSGNIVPQGVYIILTQSGTTDKAGFAKCTIKYR